MQIIKLQKFIFVSALVGIYMLSWMIEANMLVSGDISLGLQESMRLFSGGSYGKDFFEVNPPLFLYLYMPPIIWAKFISSTIFSIFTIFHAYIFLLISLSLILCYSSINKIFPKTDFINHYCSVLMLAFILLLLPMSSAFGQREHCLIILTLPYLLLVVCRLERKKINPYFAIIIGLSAGIGFAIKPFFCLTVALVELYYFFCQRTWLAWLRIETVVIVMVMMAYLYSIFVFNKAYLVVIVPFAMRFYYQGYSAAWSQILLNPAFIFCYFPILFFFIHFKNNPYKKLSAVLLIGMMSFCCSYLMQRTFWYYHIYPAYALAMLLTVIFLSLLAKQEISSKQNYILMLLISLLVFLIPLCYAKEIFNEVSFYKKKSSGLIKFLKHYAQHQPVYFLSSTLRIEYPLVDYAEAIHASQYPSVWWLRGYFYQIQMTTPHSALHTQLEKDREYFINSIADELVSNKPVFIFVESGEMAPTINGHRYDYVKNFSKNKNFQKAWKNYHYLTDINEKYFYHFKIYKLNSYY